MFRLSAHHTFVTHIHPHCPIYQSSYQSILSSCNRLIHPTHHPLYNRLSPTQHQHLSCYIHHRLHTKTASPSPLPSAPISASASASTSASASASSSSNQRLRTSYQSDTHGVNPVNRTSHSNKQSQSSRHHLPSSVRKKRRQLYEQQRSTPTPTPTPTPQMNRRDEERKDRDDDQYRVSSDDTKQGQDNSNNDMRAEKLMNVEENKYPNDSSEASLSAEQQKQSPQLSSSQRKAYEYAAVRRILQPQLLYSHLDENVVGHNGLNGNTTIVDATSDTADRAASPPSPSSGRRSRFNSQIIKARIRKSWEEAITKLLGIGYTSEGNAVEIYSDGAEAFQQMFDSIDAAKHHVFFETFIWRPDTIGLRMIDKLAYAAKRGCEVVVLYDGAGSLTLTKTHLAPLLDEPNATVVVFNDLWMLPWRRKEGHSVWFRTHRKILIVDDLVGFAGGMNCTSQYAGESIGGINTFRDTQMKIEGPAVEHLARVFEESLSEATHRLEWQSRFEKFRETFQHTKDWLKTPYNQLYASLSHQGGETRSRFKRLIDSVRDNANVAKAIFDNNIASRLEEQPSYNRARNAARRLGSRMRQRTNASIRLARSRLRKQAENARQRLLPHEHGRTWASENDYFNPNENITTEKGTKLRINANEHERRHEQEERDASTGHMETHQHEHDESDAKQMQHRRTSEQRTPYENAQVGLERVRSTSQSHEHDVAATAHTVDSAPHRYPQSSQQRQAFKLDDLHNDSKAIATQHRNNLPSADTPSSIDEGDEERSSASPTGRRLPGDVFVQVLQSNVVRNTWHIQHVMWTTIQQSVKQILITNPFFIPPKRLNIALTRAARRGVRIRIMTCGKSDTPYMRWAATHIYHKYLELGIEMYEYNERILHAKTVTIDGIYSSVGSFNMDALSGIKMLELNIAMISGNVAKQLEKQFAEDLQYCVQITKQTLENRSIFEKILHWACYHISRFMTWWFNQEHPNERMKDE